MYDPKTHKYSFDPKEVATVIERLKKAGYNERALEELKSVTAKYKGEDMVAYAEFVDTIYRHPERIDEWKEGDDDSFSQYGDARSFFVFITTD